METADKPTWDSYCPYDPYVAHMNMLAWRTSFKRIPSFIEKNNLTIKY